MMDYGLWIMGYGLWTMDYVLWVKVMDYGLLAMAYARCTMDCNQYSLVRNQIGRRYAISLVTMLKP